MYASEIFSDSVIRRWLDIGPNKGVGPEVLADVDAKVTFVDINPQFLKESLANYPGNHASAMDGTRLGFADGTFEVVTALEVVEHIDQSNQLGLYREAHRMLTKNGLFIVSTPNKTVNGSRPMSPDHKNELTPEEFDAGLKKVGFSIIKDMGQWFFTDSLFHNIFRIARQNPIAVFAYYHLIPWKMRQVVRDSSLDKEAGPEVRKPMEREMPRIIYKVCQKI